MLFRGNLEKPDGRSVDKSMQGRPLSGPDWKPGQTSSVSLELQQLRYPGDVSLQFTAHKVLVNVSC